MPPKSPSRPLAFPPGPLHEFGAIFIPITVILIYLRPPCATPGFRSSPTLGAL
jgi:hypothetical protein